MQTKSAWHPHSKEPTFSQACIIAPPSVAFCGILENIICYYTYIICKIIAYTGCLRKKRTFRMLQSVLGSKTLSGHNDRNLRMRTWVRSAVFVPRTLCSIPKVRFFWDTLYVHLSSFILIATSCPGRSSKWEPRRMSRSDHHNCLH